MSHKRSRRGSPRNHLQHRGFNLNKISLREEISDAVDNLGTSMENPAGVFVNHQINVALAVPGLGVSQPFVLLG